MDFCESCWFNLTNRANTSKQFSSNCYKKKNTIQIVSGAIKNYLNTTT